MNPPTRTRKPAPTHDTRRRAPRPTFRKAFFSTLTQNPFRQRPNNVKALRPQFLFRAGFTVEELIQTLDGAAQVRDRYRAAYDERDVEGVKEFLARHAGLDALFDVVRDAVVAAQNGRGGESHQLLR